MQVTRGQVYIAAMLVVLVLGVIAGVIVTLETASQEAAVLVGVIGTLVLPVVGAFIAIMQGMMNASKLDATRAKVDETKTKVDETKERVDAASDKVDALHEAVKPLAERLGGP